MSESIVAVWRVIMVQVAGPNLVLRALLAEASWTEEELARRVNALAGEVGVVLRLDRRSVAHWLAGRRPRAPVPDLVAEALSRGLGRTVTPAMTGMTSRDASAAGPAADFGRGDVVEMLRRLGFDSGRRRMLAAGTYSVAALAVSGWAEAAARPRAAVAAGPRLDPERVATAEMMTQVFSDADMAFGGGHSRAALSAYLASEVAPLLQAGGPARLRLRLGSAATQLTYLAGFMCFDNGEHPRAQRYYRAALELAVDNGDATKYAVTLRAMSVQAQLLGHTRQAVQLAESALTPGRNISPIRHAFLLGQLAVAAAAEKDRRSAFAALRAAEVHFDRATSRAVTGADDPMGGFHPAALGMQQAAVHGMLGDLAGAVKALTASLRHRPPSERRSRAIATARLAELHLAEGHLERAATVWHAFLDDYAFLHSRRATHALTYMRERLRPHATLAIARGVLNHAATVSVATER